MGKKFTVIPKDTFDELQLDAGVLLWNFDPADPDAPDDEDIICATTGGITINCTPTYSDFGEDVDNCPNNTKELKHLDGWECGMSTTALGTSAEMIDLGLGAADIETTKAYALTADTALVTGKTYYTRSGTDPNYTYTAVTNPSASSLSTYYEVTQTTGKVIPRSYLEQSDFKDEIWWVGDKANGGFVAVKLIYALATSGLSLQTSKNGKGQFSLELAGHVSIDDQETIPMEFYSVD